MSGKEQMKIEEAFKSNWIAPLGPLVNEFEQVVADYAGVKRGAALSSGTAAIHLALKLIGVQKGDMVFVPLSHLLPVQILFYMNKRRLFLLIQKKRHGICVRWR